jgi:UDP-3-O-[3-hydroxymyristoyl] glucosamine N-acyltransferase
MTGMAVRLSEIPVLKRDTIVRDGEFRSLGFVIHSRKQMLVPLYDQRYLDAYEQAGHVSCAIATPELAKKVPASQGLVIDADPATLLYKVHIHLAETTKFYGEDFTNEIAPTARIDPRAYIAPKNVRIGPGTVIEPNATIFERSLIGANVTIRAGCVIGAQGFGIRDIDGKRVNIPHAGGVRIDDNVEILSNCSIAKGTFGSFTTIGRDTKINACTYIAHNVAIGERCQIAASAVLAGSVRLGNDVWIGPNSTTSNGIVIGDGAKVSLGAVVTRDVLPGARVTGNFAIEHEKFLASLRSMR